MAVKNTAKLNETEKNVEVAAAAAEETVPAEVKAEPVAEEVKAPKKRPGRKPGTKNTKPAAKTEKTTKTKTAKAKKETAPAVKEEAVKVEEVKETVKAETVKAEEQKADKPKTTRTRKTTKSKKADFKKETVIIQFAGKEYDFDNILDIVRADFRSKSTGYIRKLDVYVKPEDHAAYYVVNGKTEGKVDL